MPVERLPRIPLLIVPAAEQHMPLVYHSWIGELRDALFTPERPLPIWADRSWFAAAQHALIDAVLKSSGLTVSIAVNPRDLLQIYGYCVAQPAHRILYWLYVRARFRRSGVADRLLEDAFGPPEAGVIGCAQPTPKTRWLKRWDLRPLQHALCEATR